MPFGLTKRKYFTVFCAYVLSTFAGAEIVHRYYSPDLSIPTIPPKKGELKTKLFISKDNPENGAIDSSN